MDEYKVCLLAFYSQPSERNLLRSPSFIRSISHFLLKFFQILIVNGLESLESVVGRELEFELRASAVDFPFVFPEHWIVLKKSSHFNLEIILNLKSNYHLANQIQSVFNL